MSAVLTEISASGGVRPCQWRQSMFLARIAKIRRRETETVCPWPIAISHFFVEEKFMNAAQVVCLVLTIPTIRATKMLGVFMLFSRRRSLYQQKLFFHDCVGDTNINNVELQDEQSPHHSSQTRPQPAFRDHVVPVHSRPSVMVIMCSPDATATGLP